MRYVSQSRGLLETDPQTQTLIDALAEVFSLVSNDAAIRQLLVIVATILPSVALTIQAVRGSLSPQWAAIADAATTLLGIVYVALTKWENVTKIQALHETTLTSIETQANLQRAIVLQAASRSADPARSDNGSAAGNDPNQLPRMPHKGLRV